MLSHFFTNLWIFGLFLFPQVETSLPEIIAHRGASYDAPENTVTAIK
jgi:glycerophosphoryl diester phosphodiesterase